MTKTIQNPQTLFLSVFDSIFVSEEPIMVEIVIIEISTIGGQLSEQQIANFISLYKTRCRKSITKKEALEKGLILVYLMKTILLENERQEKSANHLKNIKNLN